MITSKTLALDSEDALNLELSIVGPDQGNLRIANGETHLRLSDQLIPVDLASISRRDLEMLYNEAATYATAEVGYLTALRIYYGAYELDGVAQMDLFYKPVFLTYDEYRENTHSYMYSIEKTGNLYNIRDGQFQVVSEAVYKTAFDLFKNTLTIKQSQDAMSFEPFVQGTDVDNVLIPFQEIFKMLVDNGNDTLVLKNNVESVLHEADYSIKQSILLFAEEVSPRGVFAGNYANRGTWGPPENIQYGFTLLGY